MNNNKDMKGQFDRMKQLMNYGLNENKKQPYSGIEYSKVGADGKLYGIVREGTKFYIKVSNKKETALVENYEYIGGFRNRKDRRSRDSEELRSNSEPVGRALGLLLLFLDKVPAGNE